MDDYKETPPVVDIPVEGPFIRNGWNYDRNATSQQTGLACDPEEDVTQQQFAEECDINTIVSRFGLTGQLPENPRMPYEGDFTTVTDFTTAMNSVVAAREAFMEFPAHVRAEFDNDPQKMIAFISDDKNRAKAIELGFIPKPPEKTRDAVAAIDELAAVLKPNDNKK